MNAADQQPITRHEIMEERANRDAFRLCVLILLVVALGLTVLGIAAWNSRFMLMPLVPRETQSKKVLDARQPGTPHRTDIRPWSAPSIPCGDAFATHTCRPVPSCLSALSMPAVMMRSGHPAKAMRPFHTFPARAAGLQKISPGRA